MQDDLLLEVFAHLPGDCKTVSTLQLVSPEWAFVSTRVDSLKVSHVGDRRVFIHAPSLDGQEENTVIELKGIKNVEQLASIRDSLARVSERFRAHKAFLEISIEVATAELFLQACTFFTFSSFIEIGLRANFPITCEFLRSIPADTTVTRFDLSTKGTQLSNSDVDELVTKLPKIVGLNLSDNASIDDTGIQNLCVKVPRLKYLSVCRMTGITNQALDYIGELDDLESLELDGNPQLNDDGIELLLFGRDGLSSMPEYKEPTDADFEESSADEVR